MEIIILPTAEKAARLASLLIADQIEAKPYSVLGLATGRTMERLYAQLARMHRDEGLDFSKCRTFNLDEYVGLEPEDPHSYRSYMNEHLFNNINIDLDSTHLPNGMAQDYKREAARYERMIAESGGIDLQLLGIGKSGHIGFNEPLSALLSRTREKGLTQTTIDQNSPLFDPPEKMPRRAFTMGIGTILDSRRIIMMVTGAEKADILAKAVEGPVTSMISATALQLHASVVVIADEDASAKLEGTEYYHWLYANEPEWRKYHQLL